MYIAIVNNRKTAKLICRSFFLLDRNVWIGDITDREAEILKSKAVAYGTNNIKLFKITKRVVEITCNNTNYIEKCIDFMSE